MTKTKGHSKRSVVIKLPEVYGKKAIAYLRDARVRPVGSMSFILRYGGGIPKNVLDRFFDNVRVEHSSTFFHIKGLDSEFGTIQFGGCWLWVGARDKYGYGRFWLNGRYQTAHVLANRWFRGPIRANDEAEFEWSSVLRFNKKTKKELHHTCERENCLNPDHLLLVDHDLNCKMRHPVPVESKPGTSKVYQPVDLGAVEAVVEVIRGDPSNI
jgi:hypothetical protein